jgi:hypothetical protein
VLAGNLNRTYRMGRFVRFARDPNKRYAGRNKFVRGRSFGDLAVTILRSFGIDVASFGDPYFNNGPLDAALKV